MEARKRLTFQVWSLMQATLNADNFIIIGECYRLEFEGILQIGTNQHFLTTV